MDNLSFLVGSSMRAFRDLIQLLELSHPKEAVIAHSNCARFRLWASNVGAELASGMQSLNYRLRDAPRIRSHVILLLEELQSALGEAYFLLTSSHRASSVPKYDSIDVDLAGLLGGTLPILNDDEASPGTRLNNAAELPSFLKETEEIIDCLLRLSVTFSDPTPHGHYRLPMDLQTTTPEPHDIKHVHEMFPDLNPAMCQRLGGAMTRRRQYIKYRAGRHGGRKQLSGLDQAEHVRSEGDGMIGSSPLSQNMRESTQANVTTSKLLASENSTPFYTRSNVMDDLEIRVPAMSKNGSEGPFLCPFCSIFIPVETKAEWRKHFFEDLRPYICIWDDCSSPEQDFHDRRGWIQHMTSQHWKTWGCPFGCSTGFNDAQGLEAHLRSTHAGEVTAERVNHVSALSGRTDPRKAQGQCPMCQKVEVKTIDEYGSHVGQHLEQLALLALPAMKDVDEDEHENVGIGTEKQEEGLKDRLAIEPKASGNSADVNVDDIDNVHRYDKANSTRPRLEVAATSDEATTTDLSRLQFKDQEKLSRQDRKKQTKPAGEEWFPPPPPRNPSAHGSQPDQAPSIGPRGLSPYSTRYEQQYMHNLGNPGQPMALVSHYSPAAAAAAYGGHFGGMAFQSHQQREPDKPFQCDQCPTAFTRNHDLKRHKRIHWAVKPFPCDGCDKAFSRKDAWKRHKLVKRCGAEIEEENDGSPSSTENQRNGDDVTSQ